MKMERMSRKRREAAPDQELAEAPMLLTVEQTAALLQIGRTHAWRLVNAGAIPVVRLSPRIVRVPRQALEALIAAGGVQSARAAQPEPAEPVPLKLRA